jgi:hypothetical protein
MLTCEYLYYRWYTDPIVRDGEVASLIELGTLPGQPPEPLRYTR